MPEGTKAKGCVKLRRCAKKRTYYAAQFMQTAKNKREGLHRHLRAHPHDIVAIKAYGEDSARGIFLNSKGRKHAKRGSTRNSPGLRS